MLFILLCNTGYFQSGFNSQLCLVIIAGFILLVFVGISLGLIGSGGSILTIPILLTFFGLSTEMAFFQALFVVAISSFWGSLLSFYHRRVDLKSLLFFGIPSVIGVVVTKYLLLPLVPLDWFTLWGFHFTKDIGSLFLFVILMVMASLKMIAKPKEGVPNVENKSDVLFVLQGVLVGSLTATISVGGGFLIIPFLVIYRGLEMKKAVGTSLVLIFINATLAFLLGFKNMPQLETNSLLFMGLSASIGMLIGVYLQRFMKGEALKRTFGFFVLAVGIYVLFSTILKG
ncbi:MAG: sulfite exporter TauE/SafE family protein [Flavobacteriia bacterium]|nr:sulfite exporter TauE/SafE family protein [Flavobacteriia bacterium]